MAPFPSLPTIARMEPFDLRDEQTATVNPTTVYDELVDLLAESADAERLLAFRLSPAQQRRLDELLEKNRGGALTPEKSAELDDFEGFEHVVRLLKARLRNRRG
jgi:hypothetical protein